MDSANNSPELNNSTITDTSTTPAYTFDSPNPLQGLDRMEQVVNRYQSALNNVQEAQNGVNQAEDKYNQAKEKSLDNATALRNADNIFDKVVGSVKRDIYAGQRKEAEMKYKDAGDNYLSTRMDQASGLGGEALANSSPDTILRSTTPERLETLVEANIQTPIDAPSVEMSSSLNKQDELAKQLKEEAANELEAKERQTFLDKRMKDIEGYNGSAAPEAQLSTNPEIISLCVDQSLERENISALPLEKSAFEIRRENPQTPFEENLRDIKLAGMERLEDKFFTTLAVLSAAERAAQKRGETLDLKEYVAIYEKSKQLIAEEKKKPQSGFSLLMQARNLVERTQGSDALNNSIGYPQGILAEFLKVTHPQGSLQDITDYEARYGSYAFASAYIEAGTEPVSVQNFINGIAMIETKGKFNKFGNPFEMYERYPEMFAALPELNKIYKNIAYGMMAGGSHSRSSFAYRSMLDIH